MNEFKKTAVASASHDAKNLLFQAISSLTEAESRAQRLLDQMQAQTGQAAESDIVALMAALRGSRQTVEIATDKIQKALRLYAETEVQEHYFLTIQPSEIALEAVANVADQINEKSLDLKVEIGGEAGLVREEWFLPRDIVLEGLTNALQNAARFAAKTILLNVIERGDALVFEVEDDGPGYGHHSLQGDASGAGLLITRDAITKIGGAVILGSSPALGGALFSMEIPSHAA